MSAALSDTDRDALHDARWELLDHLIALLEKPMIALSFKWLWLIIESVTTPADKSAGFYAARAAMPCCPTARMLTAALVSRSSERPHTGHRCHRSDIFFLAR